MIGLYILKPYYVNRNYKISNAQGEKISPDGSLLTIRRYFFVLYMAHAIPRATPVARGHGLFYISVRLPRRMPSAKQRLWRKLIAYLLFPFLTKFYAKRKNLSFLARFRPKYTKIHKNYPTEKFCRHFRKILYLSVFQTTVLG